MVIIRFNPDAYKDENGDKVEGCFEFDKLNKMKPNTDEWERRKKVLIETIKHWMKTIPEKAFNEKYLFYDGCSSIVS